MNTLLENSVYYLSGIINAFSTAFLLNCILSVINGKTYTIKKYLISFCMFIPTAIFAQIIQEYLKDYLWIKTLMMFTNIYLISLLYYKTKWLKSIFVTFITFIFLVIADALISIFIIMLKLDIQTLAMNKYSYSAIVIFSSLVSLFSGRLFKFFLFDRKKIDSQTLEIHSKYMIPPFLAMVVCLIISLAILAFNSYEYSMYFILINVIQLAVVSYIGMYNLTKSIKTKVIEQEFENTKLYNKSLVVINEQIRGIKHDMGNIVQSINGYLTLKDYKGAIKYCNHVLNDFSNVNLLSVLSPNIIDEPGIYGIIARKKYIAEEKDVKLEVIVTSSCKNISFPLLELTRSIGVLLDNALEAAIESREKKIWIEIRYDYNIKAHIIIVGNSVKDPSKIDISKIFEYGYSTKKNPSGIGLHEIAKFMDKFNSGYIKSTINKDKKIFTQEMTFKTSYEFINLQEA